MAISVGLGDAMSLSSMLLAPLYDRLTRPSELACVAGWRSALLSSLAGEVLEIGAGTGANFAHYGPLVNRIVAVEPDRHMRKRLARRTQDRRIELCDAQAEELPMEDASFDVVVSTLVLCSVTDPGRALGEIRRVLRPNGLFVFLEHVGAENNPGRLRWQRRIEPLWKRAFGGCHLTRDTESSIRASGFTIESIQRESMRKAAAVVRPTVRGIARSPA